MSLTQTLVLLRQSPSTYPLTHLEHYFSTALKMGHDGFAILKTVLGSVITFSTYIAP